MSRIGRPSGGDPRTKVLSVRVSEKEYQDLSEYAKRNNTTITLALMNGFTLLKEQEVQDYR